MRRKTEPSLVADVCHQVKRLFLALSSKAPKYRDLMDKATCYEQWAAAGHLLDRTEGNDVWKNNPHSKYYDHLLIRERTDTLKQLMRTGTNEQIIFNLRTTINRNTGDMGNPALYEYTHVGTKALIEEYNDEVVRHLNYLRGIDFPVPNELHRTKQQMVDEKLKFFVDIQIAFGCTALLLSGGGAFGIR